MWVFHNTFHGTHGISFDIPKEFRSLYKNYLMELNPVTFEVFDEDYARNRENQKHANIPLVNIPFVDEKINELGLSVPRRFQEKEESVFESNDNLSISFTDLI